MSEKKAENRFKNTEYRACRHTLLSLFPDPTPQAHLQCCSRHQLQPPFPLPTSPVDPPDQSLLASFPWLIAISQLPTQADTPCPTAGHTFQKTRWAAHRLWWLCVARFPGLLGWYSHGECLLVLQDGMKQGVERRGLEGMSLGSTGDMGSCSRKGALS